MSIEIELKFALQPRAILLIRQNILSYATTPSSTQWLTNDYYDTAQGYLRQHDLGLRVRGGAQRYEMTLKGRAEGLAGIQQRVEYNIPLAEPTLDISLLPTQIWPAGCSVTQLQAELQPIFTTHFQREAWRVHYKQCEIEIAFDQGEVRSGEQSLPILELELELIKGNITELLSFTLLLLSDGMWLSDVSKAARGYRLARGQPSKVAQPCVLDFESQALPHLQLQALLKVWQQLDERRMQMASGDDLPLWQQLTHKIHTLLLELAASSYLPLSDSLRQLASDLLQQASQVVQSDNSMDYCATVAYQRLKLQFLQSVVVLQMAESNQPR